MKLLISILRNSTYMHEVQNKYDSYTNTKILTYRRLGVCVVFFAYMLFVETVNFNELINSFESLIYKYYQYFSKVMIRWLRNQTYFEWYGSDANIVRIVIATCAYKSVNVVSTIRRRIHS